MFYLLSGITLPELPILLIIFPTEYPELPPVGFYLKEDIPLSANGHLYQRVYHEACSDP